MTYFVLILSQKYVLDIFLRSESVDFIETSSLIYSFSKVQYIQAQPQMGFNKALEKLLGWI